MSVAPGVTAAAPAEALRGQAEAAADGLPALMLAAERLVAAALPGGHGQRRAGQGDEFWQYRPATAGDHARGIDWRRSARSDAAFIRDHERISPQSAALWIAGGPGMDWTGDPARPTKRARAALLALALGLLLLRGGERVGVLGAAPRGGRAQLAPLAAALIGLGADPQAQKIRAGIAFTPGGVPGIEPAALTPDPALIRAGQRLVLIGDWLDDPAPVLTFLACAAAAGVAGALLQVLDPVEESFPFSGAVLFNDPAGRARHDTRDAASLRSAYLDRLAARRAQLLQAAAAAGWRFGTHDTAAAPSEALLWLAGALGP